MNQICLDRLKYQVFLERDIEIDNNTIIIKAYNKIECTNLIQLKQELIDKLLNYGFKVDINIDLVLEGDKELKDKIEHENEVKKVNEKDNIEKVTNFNSFFHYHASIVFINSLKNKMLNLIIIFYKKLNYILCKLFLYKYINSYMI